MAPKKKTTRAPRAHRPTAATGTRGSARKPLVVADPVPRWPLAVWAVLVTLWVLGSLVSFLLVLASAGVLEEATDASRREGAWALVWLVVFAVVVPVAGAAVATLLRRRIAAVMFAFAALLSGAALWLLAPPADLWAALSVAFS